MEEAGQFFFQDSVRTHLWNSTKRGELMPMASVQLQTSTGWVCHHHLRILYLAYNNIIIDIDTDIELSI